jgi:hypothetical protein
METSKKTQYISMAIAALFITIACIQGYRNIGLPPVIIVGGSGIIGFVMWYRTYLKRPIDPKIILPLFLLTVAALEIHMCEEYLTAFGPSMSRLFGITWTEKSFLMIFAFIGPVLYTMTALGLYYRVPIAGFVARCSRVHTFYLSFAQTRNPARGKQYLIPRCKWNFCIKYA